MRCRASRIKLSSLLCTARLQFLLKGSQKLFHSSFWLAKFIEVYCLSHTQGCATEALNKPQGERTKLLLLIFGQGFSLSCLAFTLNTYSANRVGSPLKRGIPAFPSVPICADSSSAMKFGQRRASRSADMAAPGVAQVAHRTARLGPLEPLPAPLPVQKQLAQRHLFCAMRGLSHHCGSQGHIRVCAGCMQK